MEDLIIRAVLARFAPERLPEDCAGRLTVRDAAEGCYIGTARTPFGVVAVYLCHWTGETDDSGAEIFESWGWL